MGSPYTVPKHDRALWAVAARYAVAVLVTTAVALEVPPAGTLSAPWHKAWQLAATVSVVAAYPLVGQVPRKALERIGGTACGGLLGLLAARASRQVAWLGPLAPSLTLALCAAAMALGTARALLAEGLIASLRLSIISLLSTAFAAQAAAGSEALHALVQTAGVAIAVVVNVSAAVLILPQTGTMRGAHSVGDAWRALLEVAASAWSAPAAPAHDGDAAWGRSDGGDGGRGGQHGKALAGSGYEALRSGEEEEGMEAGLACGERSEGLENLLTDINAALLGLKAMEGVARQEVHIGCLAGRHVFLPRLSLLPGSAPPKGHLPWPEMQRFVVAVRHVARRLVATSELVAAERGRASQPQAALIQLLREQTDATLACLTSALGAPADPRPLHAAAQQVQQLRARLAASQQEVGDPVLSYAAGSLAEHLGGLVDAAAAMLGATPEW